MAGKIRVGIGGWTFAPWRGVFYPKGTRQADELQYASRKLTAIEINGTYYSSQKPATFAKWATDTPDGFVFSVKASRFCTNRRVLADAGESIDRFFAQGLGELGDRLGPILWQFMAAKPFARDDFAAFLDLLPRTLGGRDLRHCVEVRHASFQDTAFIDLCREHGVAICLADHPTYPMIEEMTADVVYARLMRGADDIETCYPAADLDAWAGRLKAYAAMDRDVFAFFISSGKVRAPAGAMALIQRLG
jgi:uncharacterized protein YecE (DUF72 family)